MPTLYPGSVDGEPQLPTSSIVDGVTTGHDTHHPTIHGATQALETKVGPGSSTPVTLGHVFQVLTTGPVTTGWGAAPVGTPSGTVAAMDFTTGSAAGAASAYSRGDHKHKSDRFLLPFVWTVDTVTSPLTVNYTLPVVIAADLYALNLALTTAASAGSNTKVDLKVNGTTRLSTQPEIVVGQQTNTIAAVFSSTSLSVGQLITVAVTQGSSGGALSIVLLLQVQVPA